VIGKRKKYPEGTKKYTGESDFCNRIATAIWLSRSRQCDYNGDLGGIFFVTEGNHFSLGLKAKKGGDAAFGKGIS